jgi:hypothetical protein
MGNKNLSSGGEGVGLSSCCAVVILIRYKHRFSLQTDFVQTVVAKRGGWCHRPVVPRSILFDDVMLV